MKPASSRDQAPPEQATSIEGGGRRRCRDAKAQPGQSGRQARGGQAVRNRPEAGELIDFTTLKGVAETMHRVAVLIATGAMRPAAGILSAGRTAQDTLEVDQSAAIARLEKLIEARQPGTMGRRSR